MRAVFLAALLIGSLITHTLPFRALAEEPAAADPVVPVDVAASDLQVVEVPAVVEPTPQEPTPLIEEPLDTAPVEPLQETLPLPIPESSMALEAPMLSLQAPIDEPLIETVATSTVTFLIRNGDSVFWSGEVELPAEPGTVSVTPTGSSDPVQVSNTSVLGVLAALDAEEPSFEISDLDYYPSMGFLVTCVKDGSEVETCAEWQYMVGSEYPEISIDQYELEDGDHAYLYFGRPKQVSVSKATVAVDEVFTVTAEGYDPDEGMYRPLEGQIVGLTQPIAGDPYAFPTEIATSTTDALGTATFSASVAGSYQAGIYEHGGGWPYYFPLTAVTVQATSTTGGGSGDPSEDTEDGFDTGAAFAYLASLERDGFIESELATDWAAIAFAVSDAPRSTRSAIASHLKNESFDLETASDYERHAMAMLALGVNPYTGGPEDVITPIVESFDGTQIGDDRYINDDVFALFPLLKAGYSKNDELIKDIVAFLVDEQEGNGSWVNSVDVTAAAIQALKPVSSLPGVSDALSDAEGYLREEQEADGGFGDAFATAWAIQAIESLGDSPNSWSVGDNTPLSYLAELQEEDGGLSVTPDTDANRAWATAYAIPAVEGETWYGLMDSVSRPSTAKTTTPSSDEEEVVLEMEETIEQVLAEEETVSEPLAEAFTYATPPSAPTTRIAQVPASPSVAELEVVIEETSAPQTLTASAADARGGSWLISVLSSFWSGIVSFFQGLFS